eukprot:230468-Hanusia_phi.AAC.3
MGGGRRRREETRKRRGETVIAGIKALKRHPYIASSHRHVHQAKKLRAGNQSNHFKRSGEREEARRNKGDMRKGRSREELDVEEEEGNLGPLAFHAKKDS